MRTRAASCLRSAQAQRCARRRQRQAHALHLPAQLLPLRGRRRRRLEHLHQHAFERLGGLVVGLQRQGQQRKGRGGVGARRWVASEQVWVAMGSRTVRARPSSLLALYSQGGGAARAVTSSSPRPAALCWRPRVRALPLILWPPSPCCARLRPTAACGPPRAAQRAGTAGRQAGRPAGVACVVERMRERLHRRSMDHGGRTG